MTLPPRQRPIVIDSGARIPAGGNTGDALIKASGRDYEAAWGRQTLAAAWGGITGFLAAQTDVSDAIAARQEPLVSGTNIKTLNGSTILGAGDLTVTSVTNLTYTAATRVLASDTGTDATLPLMSSGDAGLVPASGGGTTNFLRADGSFAAPPSGGGANLSYTAATGVVASDSGTDATITLADGTNRGLMSSADFTKLAAITGINTGDQASIVGITGSKAQFDAAVTDGNFMYVGDAPTSHTHTASAITDFDAAVAANSAVAANTAKVGYTDELAQDAVGAMVDASLTYVDGTPLLQRAALTGHVVASAGSNALTLGSFTKAQLDAALSDGNALYVGDAPTAHTHPQSDVTNLVSDLAGKQATLVSATNIKTVNGSSLLGAGDLVVSATPAGNTGEIQYNNAGSFAGAANVEIEGGNLRLVDTTTPSAPSGATVLFSKLYAGSPLLHQIGPSNKARSMQESVVRSGTGFWMAAGGGTVAPGLFGFSAFVITGSTATARNSTTTNYFTRRRRQGYVSGAGAGSVAQWRAGNNVYTISDGAGVGGFSMVVRFGTSDAATVSGARMWLGMGPSQTAQTNVEPDTLTNRIGIGHGASDTNMKIFYGGSAAQTPIDLGANFPANTLSVDMYELALFAPPNSAVCHYEVTRLNTGHVATGTLSGTAGTVLPASTTLMNITAYRTNNATALAVGLDICSATVEMADE